MRIRTAYSFRTAVGMLSDVMEAIQEARYPVAPISDRASTFGFVKWMKLAKKMDMRPIFGVELGVTSSPTAKRPIVDYWTFFALDDLRPLHDLLETATRQFRYEPLLDYKQAAKAKGVLKIIGSRTLLQEVKLQKDLFVSLAPSSAKGYINHALALGHELIACSDNRYPKAGELPLYQVICGKFAQTQSYPQHILTKEEWLASIPFGLDERDVAGAWDNFLDQCDRVRGSMRLAKIVKPAKPKTIRRMCEEGAKRLGVDLSDPVYVERLERELKLIKEKDFEDYFYIIADVVQWARKEMWVGPARGSSCGSLVCYLTEITTIDPIKFGLIFERFIDINRDDLPDVDIDFSDQERHKVFKYMSDKYGEERVARLGTVALYKPRSAMGEAAAALDIPRWQTEAVLESLIERSSGDSRALQSLEDTLHDTPSGKEMLLKAPEIIIAAKMEGHPRHSSQHAAGIIITEKPVKDYVAVDNRTGATHCDKKDAEELNFLKIDALGLTQGSIFEDTLRMVGLPLRFLDGIPLNDQKAFDVLNRSLWSGVFQFNGQALQSVCKQIKVDKLDDIVSVTALARPGPLASGGTNQWVLRRSGQSPVSYPHPAFEPYLKDTLGIVAYQEQVMEIGRKIGDLSWEDVTALRKAMSKSLGKEFFDQYGNRWKEGAAKRGIPPEVSNKIWDELCAYGSWAFNKSHAVAYGHISYHCCWLKAHYPFEFAAATLSHETDPMKQIMLLREMKAEGIEYLPVDPEVSTDKWTTTSRDGKRLLVGPIQNVKGIGPKLMGVILQARQQGFSLPPKEAKLLTRATNLLANGKTSIDSLWPITDAFARLLPDPAARNINTPPTSIYNVLEPNEDDADYVIFACATRIAPRNENEPQLIQRRGYKITDGLVDSLLLRMTDDTETIMCKISRWDYQKIGKPIVDRGRPGKALYAMKGRVRGGSGFRLLMVNHVKYIGDLDVSVAAETRDQAPAAEGDLSDNAGVPPPTTAEGARVY